MEDKELWMKKLKDKLGDYSEPMPASGWEQLEKELSPSPVRHLFSYRKWAMVAAAAVLVAVSTVSLLFLYTPEADEMRQTAVPTLVAAPDVIPEVRQPQPQAAVTEPSGVIRPSVKPDALADIAAKRVVTPQEIIIESTTQKVADVVETESNALPVAQEVTAEEPTAKQIVTREVPAKQVKSAVKKSDYKQLAYTKPASSRRGWSVGLGVGNISPGVNLNLDEYVQPPMAGFYDMSTANGTTLNATPTVFYKEGTFYVMNANDVVNADHHQPISVGLSIRKQLGNNFSIESGLTYTYLSSEVSTVSSKGSKTQKLHYLGIPLKGGWTFYNRNKWMLYTSAGGMIERCIHATWGDETKTLNAYQFSVSGGVGAQFNVSKRVGLYVEPGVVYYFDDKSVVETIRKEKPFNFNLQAGLRLTY